MLCLDVIPLFFLVHSFGADQISIIEEQAKDWIADKTGYHLFGHNSSKSESDNDQTSITDMAGSQGTASIWTEFVVAYAIHKMLAVIRIPVTVAIVPTVAKRLRAAGFKIGPKISSEIPKKL